MAGNERAGRIVANLNDQWHRVRVGFMALQGRTSRSADEHRSLRIPVCMHNLTEEKIFRPSAWAAFGAIDPQGADFRACANFGPLYGKY